jgi:hypothetical protein
MTAGASAAILPRPTPSADLFWFSAAWRGCRKLAVVKNSGLIAAAHDADMRSSSPDLPMMDVGQLQQPS